MLGLKCPIGLLRRRRSEERPITNYVYDGARACDRCLFELFQSCQVSALGAERR